MTPNELKILKTIVEDSRGLLSPANLINGIAQGDRRSVEHLVAGGYLEEVDQDQQSHAGTYTIKFYRATNKALMKFEPRGKRFLNFILYDKHNLFVLLSLLISIGALIVGIIALKN